LALTYGDSCEGWTHDLTLGVKKIWSNPKINEF
jgi:hypothetical protein